MNTKKMLILDVETANGLDDALVYDIGYKIIDKNKRVYNQNSFIIYDIFFNEKDLMDTAYYAQKIPSYLQDIENKRRKVVKFLTAWRIINEEMKKYKVDEVYAYNAFFDKSSLNRTIRYITKSKIRWFFPYDTKFYCIWNMACQTICTQKTFYKEAIKNNWLTKSNNFITNAEIVYKYISGDYDFIENHTALEDVEIETEILLKCLRQHKKMDKNINRLCWRYPTQFYRNNYSKGKF